MIKYVLDKKQQYVGFKNKETNAKPTKLVVLLIILFFSVANCFSKTQIQLTFEVDMNAVGFKVKDTLLNIGIRGNSPPLTWVKGIKLKDIDQDGIYTTTISFKVAEGTEIYFKYVLNEVEWEAGDARKVKLSSDISSINHTFRYVNVPDNPFKKFIGEWTLKDDLWEQSNNHQKNELIKIPNHYSICKEINTKNSLLWIVDATSARGHILWVYNAQKQEIFHSSSFFPSRSGVGQGSINDNGDVSLKIEFEGEEEGSYRLYTYTWISKNEYVLKSIQYKDSKPTGNYYGGTFVRILN